MLKNHSNDQFFPGDCLDFDIFSADNHYPNKPGTASIFKQIPVPIKNHQSKYHEVWRRVRMKLRFKSILSSLIKERQFFLGQSAAVFKKDEIVNKLIKHRGAPENFTNMEKINSYMLHPNSKFKGFWNGFISLLLIYTAIVMPLSLAFYETDEHDAWYYIDLALDLCFFIDIIVTLNSAYFDQFGALISNRFSIFCKYAKSWLFIDFFSCLPFHLILGSNRSFNSLLRLARLPRLAKLLRLSRLLKMLKSNDSGSFMRKVEDLLDIKTSVMRLFQAFMTAIILLHLMACLWFYSAKFQDFDEETWVVRFGYIDMSPGDLYLRSLYFVMTTLATVGYGDIYASTDLERILVIFWIIIVMFFMTFNISSMSNMISSIDTKESVLHYKISVIEDFCKETKLSKELKIRLKDALRYSTENNGGSMYNKQEIILELPKKLRFEVSIAMHKGYAKEIPFFQQSDPVFVSNVIPILICQRFHYNSTIYKAGDHPDEMYFIVSGRVGFAYSDKLLVFQQRHKGECFGNIELFISTQRVFSTKVMISTEVLTLKKSHLYKILKKFPVIKDEMKEIAEKDKSVSLRNIIELKVMLQLRKFSVLHELSKQDLKEYINERFVEYQKTWNQFGSEELTDSDLMLTTETLMKKVEKLNDAFVVAESTLEKAKGILLGEV